jgi:hypothetical protein
MAIIGSANIVINAITTNFENDVKKALKAVNTAGGAGGGGGGKGPFAKIAAEAEQSRLKFNQLTRAGYYLAPAIAGTVAAVGDLVMGLFAVGSAVGAATPALVVLPGILSAVAQAGIAAKLAFAGVGKAISALMKQKTSGGGGTNDNAVADARKRLAKAYQTAADQMASANDKVRKAQERLNNAYKEGAESLQQLGFDAEDASIAQSKAAIELERARETLARASGAGTNSRQYREAELALKQADLDYRKATDTVNDLAVQQEYAAETGIEGTKEVMDATNALTEAEADRAKTVRDTNQDIADAQEALTRVLNSGGSSSSSDALAGLSKEAKEFAQFIVDLQPKIQELRAAAGRMLFPLLQTSIQTLADKLFPRLIPQLELTGRALGEVSKDFADTITSADNMKRIDSILGNNVGVIENLGGAGVNLAEAFIVILDAAGPLITKFSEWVKLTTEGWTETLKAKDATGELGDIFDTAGGKAATIGGVLKKTYDAFKALGGGASDSGMKIIEAFGGAMDKLKEFAEAGSNDGMFSEGERGASSLETKFDNIADNFIIIGKFAGEMAKALFDVSGNPGVEGFFTNIMGLPMAFADTANNINSAMGAEFGEFVNQVGELLTNTLETGGMSNFFAILTSAVGVINNLFENEVFVKVFGFLAAIKGVTLAIGTLLTVGKFIGGAFLGSFLKIGSAFKFIKDPFGPLRKASKDTRTELQKQQGVERDKRTGLDKLGAASDKVKRKFGALGGASKNLRSKLATGAVRGKNAALNAMKGAGMAARTGLTAAATGAKRLGKGFLTLMGGPLGLFIMVLTLIITHWDEIKAAFTKIVPVLKAAVQKMFEIFGKVVDYVKELPGKIGAMGAKIWDWIVDKMKLAFEFYIGIWIGIFDFIKGLPGKIAALGAKIWDWIVDKMKLAWEFYKGVWTMIFDFIKGLGSKLAEIGKNIWNWIVDFFTQRYENLKTNIGLMVDFVKGLPAKLAAGASAIWTWITDKLSTAYTNIKNKFTEIIDFVGTLKDKIAAKASNMWNGIKDSFKSAINFVIRKWNDLSFSVKVPNSIFGIPLPSAVAGKGFTLDTPNIPELARGGIVPATPGGMIARIGEAGRPERVEPLDPSGMSRRDRALIDRMIKARGGRGGESIVFNIYPSQGMNEIELANMVSRKVAWNLRIGA